MRLFKNVAALLVVCSAAASVFVLDSSANAQSPLSTAFTYQGRLDSNGSPFTGTATVEVTLWDALTGGNQIGGVSSHPSVQFTGGLFTVSPNFGPSVFNGDARWIQIRILPVGMPGGTTLTPRQPVSATPYALQTRGIFVNIASNVGIGTTSPAAKLDVVGNTAFPHLRVAAKDDTATPYGAFFSLDASPVTGGKDWLMYSTGGDAGEGPGKLVFRNITDNQQGVVFDEAGNVGIGTYSPTNAKLDVVGTGTGIRVTAPDYGIFATTGGDGIAINAVSGAAPAIRGTSSTNAGVVGTTSAISFFVDDIAGVVGLAPMYLNGGGTGVLGRGWVGVGGVADAGGGYGVFGYAEGGGLSYGVYGDADGTFAKAGVFGHHVDVFGTLTKSGGSFRIDHPLDPANKFLSHSFVESPDMMNIYNGNVVTDAAGYATITMPDWFEVLNRDFRYQLTVIDTENTDDFVQAKIVKPMAGNTFTLRTSRPGTTVSWQVTGIRQDPWANANRIPVEHEKNMYEKGRYVAPVEYGLPREAGIGHMPPSRGAGANPK